MQSELIHKLIPWGKIWTSVPDGFLQSFINSSPENPPIFVSDAELKAIDNRLPSAIRLLQDVYTTVDTRHIRAMLSIWKSDIHLQNHKGEMVAVEKIDNISVNNSIVSFKCYGHSYTNATITSTNEDVLIPSSYDPTSVLTKKSWLTKHYPGWEERLNLAGSLDLNPTETLKFLLSVGGRPEVTELPDDLGPGEG